MPNDYKIENEEFWYEPLDDFQASDEIVVVEINEDDLKNKNIEGLTEVDSCEYGNWEELASITNEEEAKLHQQDFDETDTNFIVFLYCQGRYVTCISGED
jgi:hypothetical protein